MNLPDIQNHKPDVEVAIQKVGISDFKLPILILENTGCYQHTIASIDCFVDLVKDLKGISMSRIPIALHKYVNKPLSHEILSIIADNIKLNLEATSCELIYRFPYFVTRFAPVSKEPGTIYHNIMFNLIKNQENTTFKIGVEVIGTTLCPCSKEISVTSAHNQRCIVYIEIIQKPGEFVWIEDLISIAERSLSCTIYTILKREDEKYVTEYAYQHPCFVEDVARNCFKYLSTLHQISKFRVEVTALESIHLHNAKAIIEGTT